MRRPTVFIGSSSRTKEVGSLLCENLKQDFSPTLWDDAFLISRTNIENLTSNLGSYDYGIFIFGDDDLTQINGDAGAVVCSPRDNVVFEAGLFAGRLGMERCFLIVPDGSATVVKIPTDLAGISIAKFSSADLSKGNYNQCIAAAAREIRKAIKKLQEAARAASPFTEALSGLWLSRFKFRSSQFPTDGVQYNIEELSFDGDNFTGINLFGWNTIKTRKYLHKLHGKVEGRFLMGTWRNSGAHNVGSFQFSMNASMTSLSGFWLGSDSENKINHERWTWKRIEGDRSSFSQVSPQIFFASGTAASSLDLMMDLPDETLSVEDINPLIPSP